jgi:deazaflavin-dependent oxidoreductase (nitroreductase family)
MRPWVLGTPGVEEISDMANDWTSMEQDLFTQVRTGDGSVTRGYFAGRQVLLLTTTGAKSGETRTTPLVYSHEGDTVVIIASKGGSPTHPGWYHNLVANPVVTVEAAGETWQARAVMVTDETERRRIYAQHAELHASFTEYEAKADGRVIPVILLERIPQPALAAR